MRTLTFPGSWTGIAMGRGSDELEVNMKEMS